MFHDITQLHAVSIWMTMDKVSFIFILEFKHLKKLFDTEKHKSVNEMVQNVVASAEQLMEAGSWTAYLVQWVYGKQKFYQTNQLDFHFQTQFNYKLIHDSSVNLHVKKLYESLTAREKQIFVLFGEGLSHKVICSQLGLKLNCLAFHRKNIYEKLGVSSQRELMTLFRRYSKLLHSLFITLVSSYPFG